MLKFKQIVFRRGVDNFGAIGTDGTLWETFTDYAHRKPRWRRLPTGDMALPIVSLTAMGEILIAVDAKGQIWRQSNDGALANRGVYEWHHLDFEEAAAVEGQAPAQNFARAQR
ncbi:MAG: hypothetical protein WA459_18010 [Stellaceae bacterium]